MLLVLSSMSLITAAATYAVMAARDYANHDSRLQFARCYVYTHTHQ